MFFEWAELHKVGAQIKTFAEEAILHGNVAFAPVSNSLLRPVSCVGTP